MANKLMATVVAMIAAASILGCTSKSDSGSTTPATSFNLSGNISLSNTSVMSAGIKSSALNYTMGVPDASGQSATQCGDNYYYQVYCMTFSDDPVAKTGNVTCSGATGSFTVTGLPTGEGIGCIVRRSTDNSSFKTLATLEIPAASLTGTSSTLVASGDVTMAVAIDSQAGSVTVSSVSGDVSNTTPASVDSLKVTTGFYSIKCGTTSNTEFDVVACKCRNYKGNSFPYADEAHCIADNASQITADDTQQFIELNMYTATPDVDIPMENGGKLAANTAIPVISVWGASNATTSSRGTGGEGAKTTMSPDGGTTTVHLTWSSAQATNAIAWFDGATATNDGISVDFTTVAAVPNLDGTTAGAWKTWLGDVMDSATGFTCTWGTEGSKQTDANCYAELAERFFRRNNQYNLPNIHVERNCDQNGCDATLANARVYIDGVNFQYTNSGSQDAIVGHQEGVSPEVRPRFVFEPFEATPDGGGGFSQHHWWNRIFSCNVSGGTVDVHDALCTGSDSNWINCGVNEETAIRFVPTATTGAFKIIFDNKAVIKYASLSAWSNGTRTDSFGPSIETICKSLITESDNKFYMDGTKQ